MGAVRSHSHTLINVMEPARGAVPTSLAAAAATYCPPREYRRWASDLPSVSSSSVDVVFSCLSSQFFFFFFFLNFVLVRPATLALQGYITYCIFTQWSSFQSSGNVVHHSRRVFLSFITFHVFFPSSFLSPPLHTLSSLSTIKCHQSIYINIQGFYGAVLYFAPSPPSKVDRSSDYILLFIIKPNGRNLFGRQII